MAIGEKKQILRGMYEREGEGALMGGEAGQAAPVGMMAASVESKSADRWMNRAAHAAIYFLLVVAGLVIAWTFREHYVAGYNLGPSFRVQAYFRDTFRLMGMSVFLILLGLGIFILFRESMPKRWRWVTLGLLLSLLPVSFVAGFFLPVAYRSGREAAYTGLDFAQVEADADVMQGFYNDGETHVVSSGDTDFAKVPTYTVERVKGEKVSISPGGVVIVNDTGRSGFEETEAGVFVPSHELADPAGYAEKHHMTILGGKRPVMRFDETSDLRGLEPAVVPPTMPAF